MIKPIRILLAAVVVSSWLPIAAHSALAASASEIDSGVDRSLKSLQEKYPGARALAEKAVGVLVFPSIVKAGLILGGHYGEGALRVDGKTVGYYNSFAASYGLQIGAQSFGYVVYFMTQDAMDYIDRSSGWEIGVGPNVVVLDSGMMKGMTTTTSKSDVYAFFFDQQGLMAGLGLQGSKITKIEK